MPKKIRMILLQLVSLHCLMIFNNYVHFEFHTQLVVSKIFPSTKAWTIEQRNKYCETFLDR